MLSLKPEFLVNLVLLLIWLEYQAHLLLCSEFFAHKSSKTRLWLTVLLKMVWLNSYEGYIFSAEGIQFICEVYQPICYTYTSSQRCAITLDPLYVLDSLFFATSTVTMIHYSNPDVCFQCGHKLLCFYLFNALGIGGSQCFECCVDGHSYPTARHDSFSQM